MRTVPHTKTHESRKVQVKVFWKTGLIISLVLSIIGTIILNLILNS